MSTACGYRGRPGTPQTSACSPGAEPVVALGDSSSGGGTGELAVVSSILAGRIDEAGVLVPSVRSVIGKFTHWEERMRRYRAASALHRLDPNGRGGFMPRRMTMLSFVLTRPAAAMSGTAPGAVRITCCSHPGNSSRSNTIQVPPADEGSRRPRVVVVRSPRAASTESSQITRRAPPN